MVFIAKSQIWDIIIEKIDIIVKDANDLIGFSLIIPIELPNVCLGISGGLLGDISDFRQLGLVTPLVILD